MSRASALGGEIVDPTPSNQIQLYHIRITFSPESWCQISAILASKPIKLTKNNQNNQDTQNPVELKE
jgi:hypothetical protein